MTKKPFAVLALLAAVCAPTVAGAQEPTRRGHHGYGGGGLMLTSQSFDPSGTDSESGGAGFAAAGAGLFDVGAVGIGVNGGFFVGGRTTDDSETDVSEAQFGIDGGVVLVDFLYLSLGVQSYAYTIDDPTFGDTTTSYVVVPLGVGVYKATDRGYLLAQLRFGGGTASEDYTDTEEDLGYFGIRLMGQIGAANGVQFLGGMEIDTYDYKDFDVTDNYFRIILGVAFGT